MSKIILYPLYIWSLHTIFYIQGIIWTRLTPANVFFTRGSLIMFNNSFLGKLRGTRDNARSRRDGKDDISKDLSSFPFGLSSYNRSCKTLLRVFSNKPASFNCFYNTDCQSDQMKKEEEILLRFQEEATCKILFARSKK